MPKLIAQLYQDCVAWYCGNCALCALWSSGHTQRD
jgi:hypothetical protein